MVKYFDDELWWTMGAWYRLIDALWRSINYDKDKWFPQSKPAFTINSHGFSTGHLPRTVMGMQRPPCSDFIHLDGYVMICNLINVTQFKHENNSSMMTPWQPHGMSHEMSSVCRGLIGDGGFAASYARVLGCMPLYFRWRLGKNYNYPSHRVHCLRAFHEGYVITLCSGR